MASTTKAFQIEKHKATWENQTTSKQIQTRVVERFNQLQLEHKAQLENRKAKYASPVRVQFFFNSLVLLLRLAELLKNEQEQYQKELDSLVETNETRKEKMLQRARELKAAREEERRQFAEAQMYRKWRYVWKKKKKKTAKTKRKKNDL
jgi:hypothetical protein